MKINEKIKEIKEIYLKQGVLNVEPSLWLEMDTLTFLENGRHPLKSGNQCII